MSAARRSLATLQPTAPAAAPPMPTRAPEPRSPEVGTPDLQTPEVRTTKVRSTGVRRSHQAERAPVTRAEASAPVAGLPKYKRLDRKEALIWPDQLTQLSLVTQRLNRARGGAGERITDNTLIRVAIALLLSRAGDLAGITEEDLRRSLRLPD